MARTVVESTQPFRIDRIDGVGRGLADRIRQAYGSDDSFQKACDALDLDRLFAMEGVSQRRAFDIASHARNDSVQLAASPRAKDVRRDLEDALAAHAHTSFGQRALRLLPVLRDPDRIRERVGQVLATRDLVERVDREAVASALSRLRPFKEAPRPAGVSRFVLVDDEEQEMRLRSRGLDRWLRIRVAREGLREAAEEDLVLYAGSKGVGAFAEHGGVIAVDLDDPDAAFVPELATEFLSANRSVLEALDALARALGRPSVASPFLQAGPAATLSLADLDAVLVEAQAVAQRELEHAVADLSVSGAQLLDLFSKGMPVALAQARARAVEAARASIRERLALDVDPFAPGLPLQLDDEEVSLLRQSFGTRGRLAAFERASSLARTLAAVRPQLDAELHAAFRFDIEFALGCYASQRDAHPATTGRRLAFQGGRNLRLWGSKPPQAIDYWVGGDHPVTVLTGANSGGKSSLLELMAQIVILHHWGLPVPAQKAEVPILDEVILLAGARGVDAGTFETFLSDLFPPLTRPGKRLILLDEVESMTELEAAGRILGVFLEEVVRSGSLCSLVTHLPTEVLERTSAPVRVDGIDAVGLDDKFNLLVDRQPKLNHRARSTPELILRRVHARANGGEKALYEKVLRRWSDG